MEANCTKQTERILDLTLEIIYLLTGEDNIVAKKSSGDGQNSVMVPLQSLLIPQRNKEPQILEVTKKMMELLTGEFPIRCQDVTVYFSMEEWEYLEGHKDLYKEVEVASEPSLTSADGSSNGNPPDICLHPLYSGDSTQDDLPIPHNHQGEDVFEMKTGIKEEIYTGQNQLSMMEAEMMAKTMNVESTLDDRTEGHNIKNTSEGHPILSATYMKKDFEIVRYSPGMSIVAQNVHSDFSDLERSTEGLNYPELKDESHTVMPNVQPSFQCKDGPPDPRTLEESSPSNDLVIPKRIYTMENPFSCPQSEKTFIKNIVLSKQQRIPTTVKPFSCWCGKSFTKKVYHSKHMRIHTGEKPFSCSECGKSFTRSGSRDSHMRIHSGEKPFSCSECGRSFLRKEKRDNHMRIHTGEKPFSCSECGKGFSTKETRDYHLRIHFDKEPIFCSECGKSFTHRGYLNKHMRSHKAKKQFYCSECGKCFPYKGRRDVHMRIHTGEKPFSCSECGKNFSHKGSRDSHMRTHTGEKPFSCLECGKTFSCKRLCDNHRRSHTGEKPFSCPECGKSFLRKEKCNEHMRVHTGEKPFSCSECGKCFYSKEKRDRHSRIHSRKGTENTLNKRNPFSCSECGKSFTSKGSYDKHVKIHSREKPFSCSECGKCFSRKKNHEKHMRTHSGEERFS